MTAVTEPLYGSPTRARRSIGWTPGLVAGATLLTLLANWPLVQSVLAGNVSDPDDAMRLVEVRAWLAGQSWFDMTAYRLDPPAGASMHWSRLVDVPNAALIKLFGLFTAAPMAEALDRIVLPTILLAGLYAAIARLATVLGGRRAVGPAVVGTLINGSGLVTFAPGRIGHHAPETLAFVLALGAALASLEPRYARQAAIAGGLIALSLGMSLETMPFLAALCVAMVLLWVWEGAEFATALRWFAGGLALGLPAVFLATVGPDRWFASTCDAFGMAQFGAGFLGAIGGLLLTLAKPASRVSRALATAPIGGVIILYVVVVYPACLHGPFASVDPEVAAVWLAHVVESYPLLAFVHQRPSTGLAIALPVGLGLLGALAASVGSTGTTRLRFAVLAALIAVGLAFAFWQVRVFTTVAPIAVCGGLPLVARLRARLAAGKIRYVAALAVVAILPFASDSWIAVLPEDPASAAPVGSCRSAEALAPLATLPPGRVVSTINEGSHLLVATPHQVFAAPYHRNNDGNRYVLDVLQASPSRAQAMLASRSVSYVMICPGQGEIRHDAIRAPGGLAAHLAAGDVPAYLQPVPGLPTPWRVYAVKPGAN